MILYTARYQNSTLAAHPAGKVQMSLGAPKFRLAYDIHQLLDLAPAGWMLTKPEAEFSDLYVKLLERRGGVPFFGERFAEVARTAGVDQLALLCFEDIRKPGLFCHRRIFARWWEQRTGDTVEELPEKDLSKLADSITEAAARLAADAERQGFPRAMSDPSVLSKIAGILRLDEVPRPTL